MECSVLTLTFCLSIVTVSAQRPGELNSKCRVVDECGRYGYICARNRTCQCLYPLYIPDKTGTKCLGVVNQDCKYDEHCIEGAYCMGNTKCKCKDYNYLSDDGLTCSNSNNIKVGGCHLLYIIFLLYFMRKL